MSDSGPNRWVRAAQYAGFPDQIGTVRCGLCPFTFTGLIAGVYRRHAAEHHPHLPAHTTRQSNKPPPKPSARERAVIERRERAVALLTSEPQTTAQLAEQLVGVDSKTVSATLSVAVRQGMAKRVAPAVWKLPEPEPEPGTRTRKQERRQERDRKRWPERGQVPPPCPKCGRNDIASPGPYALHVSACTGDPNRTRFYLSEGHVHLSADQIRQIESELAVSPRTAAELAEVIGVEDSQGFAIALTWEARKGRTRARKFGNRNYWSKKLWAVDESPEPIPPYIADLRRVLANGPLTAPEIALAWGLPSAKSVGSKLQAAVKYGHITFTGKRPRLYSAVD